jgi:hypothetical protein
MICAAVVSFLLVGFYISSYYLLRSPAHTASDVITLIRCVDQQELEDLCSEIIEENLSAGVPVKQFRAEQRKRARLLFEYLQRMSFNSWLLLSWAHNRQERLATSGLMTDQTREATREIIVAGTTSRIHSLALSAKLLQQLLAGALHLPMRRLPGVRKTEALIVYRQLTGAAVKLAASEGPDAQSRLRTSLFGRFM